MGFHKLDVKCLTSSNTQACEEIVGHCPYGCLQLQRDPVGLNAAVQRDSNDHEHVEPVHMLVPILRSDWCVCYMYLALRLLSLRLRHG